MIRRLFANRKRLEGVEKAKAIAGEGWKKWTASVWVDDREVQLGGPLRYVSDSDKIVLEWRVPSTRCGSFDRISIFTPSGDIFDTKTFAPISLNLPVDIKYTLAEFKRCSYG